MTGKKNTIRDGFNRQAPAGHLPGLPAMSIAPLEPGDLAAYAAFCRSLPSPEKYTKYHENDGEKLFGPGSTMVMFALRDGAQIVGQTAIAFDPDGPDKLAVFCETEITPAYRGRGLAKHLHNARMAHLRDAGFRGEIETHIRPGNTPSLKAARRNGFHDTGQEHKGYCVLKARNPAAD